MYFNVPQLLNNTWTNLLDLNQILAKEQTYSLSKLNWAHKYPYLPDVEFQLFYQPDTLYLRFEVTEEAVLASKDDSNQAVCEDSCVELFISFDNENYFNFEFNCIGVALVGYGGNRHSSISLSKEKVSQIKTWSSLGNAPFPLRQEKTCWQMVAAIPTSLLLQDKTKQLKSGMIASANLYKCGENLPQRHYVSWMPIDTPEPDFHQPSSFAPIKFL